MGIESTSNQGQSTRRSWGFSVKSSSSGCRVDGNTDVGRFAAFAVATSGRN